MLATVLVESALSKQERMLRLEYLRAVSAELIYLSAANRINVVLSSAEMNELCFGGGLASDVIRRW